MNLVQIYMHFFIDNIPIKHEFESCFLISFGELYLANQLNNPLFILLKRGCREMAVIKEGGVT